MGKTDCLRRAAFRWMVRTPAVAAAIVAVTVLLLVIIAKTYHTSEYATGKGTIQGTHGSSDAYIRGVIDGQYAMFIAKDAEIIWYTEPQGKRYTATVTGVERVEDGVSFTAIPPDDNKMRLLLPELLRTRSDIHVEVLIRSRTVLESFFSRGGG